jgi:hypothetical protein
MVWATANVGDGPRGGHSSIWLSLGTDLLNPTLGHPKSGCNDHTPIWTQAKDESSARWWGCLLSVSKHRSRSDWLGSTVRQDLHGTNTHILYICIYIFIQLYIYISHIYMYMYIMGMIVLFASHRLRIFLVDPPEVHLWRCGGRSGSGDDVYQWRLNVALRLMQIIYDIWVYIYVYKYINL